MTPERNEAGEVPEEPAALESEQKTPRRKWARAFEGWQAGAVIVGCAALTAALVVPRPVVPTEIPPPRVEWDQLAREESVEKRRVEHAHAAGLPYEVRAVGEALRQIGAAEARGDAGGAEAARKDADAALHAWAAKYEAESLLELRALQTELFVNAVHVWEKSPGEVPADLSDLGGDFPARAKAAAWLAPDGTFADTDDVLRLLFRLRFSKVLDLDKHPFTPTLNDTRLYYRFRLARLAPEATRERADLVARFGVIDSQYPTQVALGVLAFQQGNFAEAAEYFEGYRLSHPTGPWSLRVQNHLTATLEALE